jgi:hypothetical protein
MSVLRIASVIKMPHRYGAGIITFQKLETLTNNLVYVAAWYIAGRGQPKNWAESCSTIYSLTTYTNFLTFGLVYDNIVRKHHTQT